MPKQHQIIFLNGPRRSGKDTAANFIAKEHNCRLRKFAAPLKRGIASIFDLKPSLIAGLEQPGSPTKTVPLDELGGLSWVETLIWLSEVAMKPRFGVDIFGRLMVGELCKPTGTSFTVLADCGFALEVLPVIAAFGLPNCHLFRIYREGHTFMGDSRSYIFEEAVPSGLHVEDIHNDYELSMFRIQVLKRVDKIVGREMVYDIPR